MFTPILENISHLTPLVHCITNYISANDCANVLLACGASPIMADATEEVAEITSPAHALVLNMGTLNSSKLTSMIKAGKKANHLGIPVILDPVGVGASTFRKEAAKTLLDTIKFTVIRGNASEIQTLMTGQSISRGIDVYCSSSSTPMSSAESNDLDELATAQIQLIKNLSHQTGAIIAISGATDLITNGHTTYSVFNGHSCLSRITGTGCMLTSLIGAYCGANPTQPLEATVAAVGTMGYCGELAYRQLEQISGGMGTLRILLIDAISLLTPTQLQGGIRYAIF